MYSLLVTSKQTILHVSGGVLGHANPTDVVDPIYARIPEDDGGVVFLVAASGTPFWIMGDLGQRSIFSFRVRQQASGGIALEHPTAGKIFRAADDGRIYIDREVVGGHEVFTQAAGEVFPRDLLVGFGAILSSSVAKNLLVLSKMPPFTEMSDIAYAIARLENFSSYSHIIDQIKDFPSYEFIFPQIQEMMRAEYPSPSRYFHAVFAWGGGDMIDVGKHSYGFPRILPYPPARLKVGAFCSIAEAVTIVLGNHLTKVATTFPFQAEALRWPSRHAHMGKFEDDVPSGVVIGNDVWIGRGATILPGAVIGDGCIIGADAVVRGRVEPYSIYLGNPGYVLRARFDPETTGRLIALKWWEWPDWKIDRYAGMMMGDLKAFLDKAEQDPWMPS